MITILLNTLLLLVNSIQIIGEVSHSKTQFSECNHENKKIGYYSLKNFSDLEIRIIQHLHFNQQTNHKIIDF